jgi:hypothetical protein
MLEKLIKTASYANTRLDSVADFYLSLIGKISIAKKIIEKSGISFEDFSKTAKGHKLFLAILLGVCYLIAIPFLGAAVVPTTIVVINRNPRLSFFILRILPSVILFLFLFIFFPEAVQ